MYILKKLLYYSFVPPPPCSLFPLQVCPLPFLSLPPPPLPLSLPLPPPLSYSIYLSIYLLLPLFLSLKANFDLSMRNHTIPHHFDSNSNQQEKQSASYYSFKANCVFFVSLSTETHPGSGKVHVNYAKSRN